MTSEQIKAERVQLTAERRALMHAYAHGEGTERGNVDVLAQATVKAERFDLLGDLERNTVELQHLEAQIEACEKERADIQAALSGETRNA